MFAKAYSQCYELFNSDKPYKKEIEFIYEWAGRPRDIVDLGCGRADYWKFYPKDVVITGIDRSKDMIAASDYKDNIVCGDIMIATYKLPFDLVTALFDVINYLPRHDWWASLPLEKGGYFIFDCWDKEKVDKDGFKRTIKNVNGLTRTITPLDRYKKPMKGERLIPTDYINLEIKVEGVEVNFKEIHTMFLYSYRDIKRFCGNDFEIVEIKKTENWQKWFKLIKK